MSKKTDYNKSLTVRNGVVEVLEPENFDRQISVMFEEYLRKIYEVTKMPDKPAGTQVEVIMHFLIAPIKITTRINEE